MMRKILIALAAVLLPAVHASAVVITVTNDPQISKGKYVALVAEARTQLDEMQKCLPREELNGELNEHLRTALIHYDEAVYVFDSGSKSALKQYWEQARAELSKIK